MHHSYIDRYSDLDSMIHRIDPQIKIIAFIGFILFVIFTPAPYYLSFAGYTAVLACLAGLTRIPVGFVLKRSLVVVPFVLLIAIFIPFFKPGRTIGSFAILGLRLAVSYEGLMILWNALVKSYLCTLCMILLVNTTRISGLLKVLGRFRPLRIFTLTISFMYRYLFVIQDELMMMRQARQARSFGGSQWRQTRTLANMTGVLFIRAYERAEFVYLAMKARGFDGAYYASTDRRVSSVDLFFLAGLILLVAGIRYFAH